MMRNRTYQDMEKASDERHRCKLQALAEEAR
jgi:hypothetical protein